MAKRKYVKENNLVKAINTDSLELQKPLVNEYYDINVHNSNMDKIDAGYKQNKNDIFNINYELSKTENTKYSTENGVKEFSCKAGYVDNVYMEGETLVNLVRSVSKVSVWDNNRVAINLVDYKYLSGTYTIFNFSDKTIVVDIGDFEKDTWKRTFALDKGKIKVFDIEEGEIFYNVNGLFADGWENNDASKNEFRNSIVLLEGDHTDKPISYFEGLKSVGQGDKIEVLTINGSKYDLSGATYATGFFDSTGGLNIHDKHKVIEQYLEVEEGKIYVLENIAHATCYYDVNKNLVHYNIDALICNSPYPQHIQDVHNVYYAIVKIPKGVKYIRVSTGINSVGKINIYKDGKYDHKQISTTLRSLPSGVKDTIEKRGNRYVKVQRCGEVVLNGNGDWYRTEVSQNNTIQFAVRKGTDVAYKGDNEIFMYCDKIKAIEEKYWNNDDEFIFINNLDFVVSLMKSKLSSQDVEGFKTWLQSNPITVVYELETPIITELPNFNPQTYEGDTTLLLNTGAIQGECEFEVTNSKGSEIEVLKDKVSSLDVEVQKAFQYGDNVKTQLVDKLISEGLYVSTNNTFEELIGNIALGKKWASGIYSYSAYERINNKKIPVPILDFTPSIIIVKTDNLTYRSASLETYKTCSNLIISNNPVKIPTTNANGYATLSCSYSDGYITISTIAQDVCTDNAGSQEWYIYE